MKDVKRVIILLPKDILEDIDKIAQQQDVSRTDIINQALKTYVKFKKKLIYRKKMIKGYIEMGKINKELANQAIEVDSQANKIYEEILSECE